MEAIRRVDNMAYIPYNEKEKQCRKHQGRKFKWQKLVEQSILKG